jgi:hypothetical protein
MKHKLFNYSQFIFLTFILFCFCNCGYNNKTLIFSNDMDMATTWKGYSSSNVIYVEKAHSGKYVCKLDVSNPFSPTFYSQIKKISSKPLKSLVISEWIFLKGGGSDPSLVADFRDKDEKTLEWLSEPAKDAVLERNIWVNVYLTIDLTKNKRNNPENYIRIYSLNNSKEEVLVDDLKISFE